MYIPITNIPITNTLKYKPQTPLKSSTQKGVNVQVRGQKRTEQVNKVKGNRDNRGVEVGDVFEYSLRIWNALNEARSVSRKGNRTWRERWLFPCQMVPVTFRSVRKIAIHKAQVLRPWTVTVPKAITCPPKM